MTILFKKDVYRDLLDACAECLDDNWDGEGSVAVKEKTICFAADFILALPENIETPEIAIDPDGEIDFEWYGGKGDCLNVCVNVSGRLAYANFFNGNGDHGVENKGKEIPESIGLHLKRFIHHENN